MCTIVVMSIFGRKCIHDVMHVLDLAHNLLSVGQLMRTGYYVMFDNDECMIYDKKGA